jgi:predicted DNA-binding protein YlxM (UPF0122 family)
MRSAQSQELIHPEEEFELDRPRLTDSQIEFFHVYLSSPFLPLREIAKQIGVQQRTIRNWINTNETFKKQLATEQNRSRAVSNMSRKRVMRGMLEAADMAREMRQPNTLLSSYKEIGRMCGFYEPEKREIMLSVKSEEIIEEMKTLTREQLLAIAQEQDNVDPVVAEVFDRDGSIDES